MSRSATQSAVLLCLIANAPLARAQSFELKLTLEAEAGVTSNGAGAPRGDERPDQVTSVRPTLQITSRGPRLKLDARIGADAVAYARNTQPDRVFPVLAANATATVVDRLVFVDSSVSVQASERDPYAARSDAGSTQNREIVNVFRLNPYVDRELDDGSTVHASYEEIVSHGEDDPVNDQRFTNTDLSVSRKPLPWGGTIAYDTHAIHYSFPADSRWKIETLKASGDVAVGSDVVLGPSVGTERTTLLFDSRRDTLHGLHLRWAPSERTLLAAEAEHRFFGTGWNMEFRHRMPWLSFSVLWNRSPVTSSESLGVAGSGTSLNAFLDAILTTRYPDPGARAAIVDGLVANRGLQNSLQGPVDVRADYVQLQNRLSANAVLLGTRNLLAVGVYALTLRGLDVPGDALQNVFSGAADSRQVGANLDFNRKLEPELTLDFNATWSRITSLALGDGQSSTDQSYRLSAVRALSPQTSVAAGLRYDSLRTNLSTLNSYQATSTYVGMNHKF